MSDEFRPDPKIKSRNRFMGSWKGRPCHPIDLPFSAESLKRVLAWGAKTEGAPHTHQEVADWCDRMHMALLDADKDAQLDRAVSVAADVDCQWELFLVNTYPLDELQKLDMSNVRLPVEWFSNWLRELKDDTKEGDSPDHFSAGAP